MKIAVLGTGMVGTTIATKLVSLGHEVLMGAREANNEKAAAWAKGARAAHGTFADVASMAELVFNCTNGAGSMAALTAAGTASLRGKIVVDVANPLDFSKGMPPSLLTTSTESLGEQLQLAFPDAKVVKTLNTVNCNVMVEPSRVPGDHDIFVCGNDAGAKAVVTDLLKSFGWQSILDLGPISAARGTEMYLILWLRLWGVLGTGDFNIKAVRPPKS
jgi:predicted dinucleotide-binding enzyme